MSGKNEASRKRAFALHRMIIAALSLLTLAAIPAAAQNTTPTFTSDPVILSDATEDLAYVDSLTSSVFDPDTTNTLTFGMLSGPVWLTVEADGTTTGTPDNSDVGLNVFTVSVTDDEGASDTAELRITVINTNDPPIWTADPVVLSDATQDLLYADSLAGYVFDPDAASTLTFSVISGPTWLGVVSDGDTTGTPENDDVGLNVFTVLVTDDAGATATAELRITVLNVNDPPAWYADPFYASDAYYHIEYLDSIFLFAYDIDTSDTLTFSKLSGPAWLSISTTGVLSGVPGIDDLGVATFGVRVEDTSGAYVDATMLINVLLGEPLLDGDEPNPLFISFWAWFDGANSDSLNGPGADSNGQLLNQWDDVSEDGDHNIKFTTGGGGTIVTNSVNGHPSVLFIGGNDDNWASATVDGHFRRLENPCGLFIVTRLNAYGSGTPYIFDGTIVQDDGCIGLRANATLGQWEIVGRKGISPAYLETIPSANLTLGEFQVHSILLTPTTGTLGVQHYINGSLATSGTFAETYSFGGLILSSDLYGSNDANCNIAEILAYSFEMDETYRRPIEEYLGDKYGIGISMGGLRVSPLSLTFGEREIGGTSITLQVSITNTGAVSRILNSIELSPGATPPFSIVGGLSTPLAFPPGASRVVDVTFDPTVIGNFNETLDISTDSMYDPVIHVSLMGSVVESGSTSSLTSDVRSPWSILE
ncbi:choice-of-anchor D domain-containing protein [Candidatus Sumerlaeota bacterium]|nr:choice-of-anchor D domain-containing protein [Candidatus Sumerlaeota bacterium]